MTTSTENIQAIPVPIPARLDVDAVVPAFSKAMNNLDRATARELDRAGLSASLRELVRLRASQLNGCSYCVDVHGAAAIAAGEPVQRVLAVAVWRESAFFTARERAALAFTESVTLAAQTKVPAAEFALVAEQFSTEEVGALLALVITINAWNAIGVAARPWEPTLAW
ncbi:MAG TPA: carboxymuconolactone decarboxylase family protein [Intrasporangium sp.]|uniref:carboxymuconolactone decarboxylase family protein n=1 Tax=Intrasporangium sp. TaxID=1925024 RepID=UPI002B465EC3|nr:carboxymuconolactone decarboxylase family protein [Intrasporangium sp.]HKX66575.1 carboxymuconolactone decarboxylase family protein [Intrasporangium sp.]